MIKKIIVGGICLVLIFLGFKFCSFKKQDTSSLENQTNLIQQQIVNVGKLVVTEGHFAEVLTYKDKDSYFGGLVSFDKKALIVVNADVTVAYDLSQIKYDINKENKTVTIVNIPKEEIKISPDIKFYDVDQSKLNPFTGDDYNKVNASAKASLAKKIENSTLKTNAQNRLISELYKMQILTNSMGWKLIYKGNVVGKEQDLKL
jgi:lipopolysaccharide export LptBFGC system permease protein LptF